MLHESHVSHVSHPPKTCPASSKVKSLGIVQAAFSWLEQDVRLVRVHSCSVFVGEKAVCGKPVTKQADGKN